MRFVARVRHKGFCYSGDRALGEDCCERTFVQTPEDIETTARSAQRPDTISFTHTGADGKRRAIEFNIRDLCSIEVEQEEENEEIGE